MKLIRCDIRAFIKGTQVPCEIVYNPQDNPYAVIFRFGPEYPQWEFSRDLLVECLEGPAGIGDVRIERKDDYILLTLTNANGEAEIAFPRLEFYRVSHEIFELVPMGREEDFVDWDAEIALLLGES